MAYDGVVGRPRGWSAPGWGLVAGAAGTTVLNAVTYLDMALRGRPASSMPRETVESGLDALGVEVPGGRAARDDRAETLGALAGIGAE